MRAGIAGDLVRSGFTRSIWCENPPFHGAILQGGHLPEGFWRSFSPSRLSDRLPSVPIRSIRAYLPREGREPVTDRVGGSPAPRDNLPLVGCPPNR
jgi:hypothetical protein